MGKLVSTSNLMRIFSGTIPGSQAKVTGIPWTESKWPVDHSLGNMLLVRLISHLKNEAHDLSDLPRTTQ